MNLPVEKNKEYEIEIESVTNEAMGVGHIDGFCVFVAGAVTGDVVKALILKVKKGYAYAKVTEIIKESEFRQRVECDNFHKCGGCQLMHIDYSYQEKIKENIVNDALLRLGGLSCKVSKFIGANNPKRYRNKMIFPFGRDKDGQVVLGFYRQRSHDVIPLCDCLLGDEINKQIIEKTLEFVKENHLDSYNEISHTGILRRLYVRKGYYSNEVMVVLSINGKKLVNSDSFVEKITSISNDIKSVILNINTKRTNNVLGDKNTLLYGKDTISDTLLGIKYEISPFSFYQINPEQTEKLYNTAIDFADIKKDDFVMDIYCGIGTISLTSAKKAKKVIGVEIVPEAIENAKQNAISNNIKNAEFYADDAQNIVPKLIEKGERPDVVILDPPRKGSDEKTLTAIVKASPKKIVYVSCNPSTLARDLKFLEENGYKTEMVYAVDQFAQTTHIESVARLVRK